MQKRDGFHVMLAPAGTPMPIREKLSAEVQRILRLLDMQELTKLVDYALSPSTPKEMMAPILQPDIETCSAVIVAAGLKPK